MKKASKATRTSAKQKFAEFKTQVFQYISQLRNPASRFAFSVKGYEVVAQVKKPNVISVPELLAIVGTAGQLGKEVRVTASQSGDFAQLNFLYVDQPLDVPLALF